MGMFDKDKEIGLILTRMFDKREEFIVYGARIVRDDFPTNIGPATQAELQVARTASPGERFAVTTLASAIADKVKEAEDSDFPAIVFWTTAETKWGKDATVLQFVRQHTTGKAEATPAADDTIPF